MPKPLLDFLGYSFFFWSNENAEPPHIHICKGHPTGLTILTKFKTHFINHGKFCK